jgi:hypothetical protein
VPVPATGPLRDLADSLAGAAKFLPEIIEEGNKAETEMKMRLNRALAAQHGWRYPAPMAEHAVRAPAPRAKHAERRGRPPVYDWGAIQAECFRRFLDDGFPDPSNYSAVADSLHDWCKEQGFKKPNHETLRKRVKEWAEAWERSLAQK